MKGSEQSFETEQSYEYFFLLIFFRHYEVKNKTNNDICAQFDSRGEIKFSSTIPTTNSLSR